MEQSASKTPVVLRAGSCVIELLLEGLAALSGSFDRFDFIASRDETTGRQSVSDDVLSRCVLLVEEASPWKSYHALSEQRLLPENCPTIRVPTIHFNSLWPLMAADPRNAFDPPEAPWGRFPFPRGDRLAISLLGRGGSLSEKLSAYFATDIRSIVNTARNHQLELADMFERERGCDVNVAAYVAHNRCSRRLFYTNGHPTPELLTFALIQILSHPAAKPIMSTGLVDSVESAAGWMEERAPFPGDQSPYIQRLRNTSYSWCGTGASTNGSAPHTPSRNGSRFTSVIRLANPYGPAY